MRLSLFPYKTSVVLIVLSYLIIERAEDGRLSMHFPRTSKEVKQAECYPFSSFPMYAEFTEEPIITYFTNAQDAPVAINTLTTAGATAAKKDYYKFLSDGFKAYKESHPELKDLKKTTVPLEVKQTAGRTALRDFLTLRCDKEWLEKNPDTVLRLYEGVISRAPAGGSAVVTRSFLAEASYASLTPPNP